jgi:spore coat protein CotH
MASHFSSDGLLYKAEATGDHTYRGDDPTSYVEVFELEAGGTKDDAAAFTAELPQRIDFDQFVTYLAMMDLIENADDIDGPGNNSYLYLAPETEQVTIVP